MSMIRTHIIIGSAEKISQHISQHKYKSGYERPAHPAEPPAMVCKSKGLSFSSPPLIQGQCCLPPPSCCSSVGALPHMEWPAQAKYSGLPT